MLIISFEVATRDRIKGQGVGVMAPLALKLFLKIFI
jgi:hypothetical protein